MQNIEIAWVFEEMADLLEIKGTDFFKMRAYRQAAKTIVRLEQPLAELAKQNSIHKIAGVGKAINAKIKEILATGSCATHRKLLLEIPKGVLEIRLLPGIGPKKTRTLFEDLGITSLAQLAVAAKNRLVRQLPGMSTKTESDILRHIQVLKTSSQKKSLGVVRELGAGIIAYLAAFPGVTAVEFGGSTRRWQETVADLDLIAATNHPQELLEVLSKHPRVTKILEQGENRVRVLNQWGIVIDLSVVPAAQFITAWHRNTGSQKHYQHLKKLAIEKNITLDHQAMIDDCGNKLAVQTEADIYRHLNMTYIPPELREDHGEIEAALAGKLPELVELKDIKGDLHTHTTWSDAAASLPEMVQVAQAKGYSYLAITDHSPSLKVANGLDWERLQEQCREIDQLNQREQDFTVLTGVECDILADGSLDHPDEVLADLDVVVASVHTNFQQDQQTMTNRIIAAIENEYVDIIGHVTGRLLGRRSGYALDLAEVFAAAAKYDTVLEINASPHRLDLNTENTKKARELGVQIVINSDAHDAKGLNDLEYGVAVARRAWLTSGDVLNTMALDDLLKSLK
ncbi:MAG: DNA polymerase/3'-5' exonuclease PolX [Desulfotomaculum sp.]|nr:DNA polymerase/3'-5' exonuclease PolX [Desulfotomaculum sp.]